MRYGKACVCQYDGTGYSGWQRQKNGISIQEIMETALEKVYGEPVKIAGSGRTDAGVHALGQVFSFSSEIYRPDVVTIKGTNTFLPPNIVITDALDTTLNFHAGKDIISKTYVYKIINAPTPSPFHINRALWIKKYIDTDKLNDILTRFVGVHDFASFCVKKTKKDNTVREIYFAKATRNGAEVDIEINAKGFLHNMTRIIVGTVIKFMQYGTDLEKIDEIIMATDRRKAGPTAPPFGLYQKSAIYNDDGVQGLEGIPDRFRI